MPSSKLSDQMIAFGVPRLYSVRDRSIAMSNVALRRVSASHRFRWGCGVCVISHGVWSPSRPTVCVSCGGWERGLAVEAGKSPKPETCRKNAARTHHQRHAVLGGACYSCATNCLRSRERTVCTEMGVMPRPVRVAHAQHDETATPIRRTARQRTRSGPKALAVHSTGSPSLRSSRSRRPTSERAP